MRRMHQFILIAPRRGLYGAESEFAPLVRGDPAKSGRNFFPTSVRIFSDAYPRRFIGLPDFQQCIRHRLAVAIQNPPTNYYALPFSGLELNLFPAQCGKPDREKRPNCL